MGFTTFGLSDRILKGVQAAGYTTPTPIQSLAIQPALEGLDVIGCAQTGTGKTAAFVLPMLHRLSEGESKNGKRHVPRALVVVPTRELAQQVFEAVTTYGKFLDLRAVAIYGGVNMEGQLKILRRGVDVVIATPGRLLDHMQQRSLSLAAIQVLILDEADRMLDMGFIPDVRRIIAAVPEQRQTMLFSATLSDEINKLAASILTKPHMVDTGERRNPAETITQYFYQVSAATKTDLLIHALEKENMESVLVFTRTKHGADKITRRLERKGISAVAIHSNRSQSQRQKALNGFKDGRFRVLVATDIAARGLDVDGISHVINFDIPQYAEDYVHRIGRTGRAGEEGDAVTFVSSEDRQYIKKIERFIGKTITVRPYEGFTPPVREKSAGDMPSSRPHGRSFARPAHGSPRHGNGSERSAHGSSRPAHGTARPSNGSARPAHGTARPSNGSTRSAHGSGRPSNGSGHSAFGKQSKFYKPKRKKQTFEAVKKKKSPPGKMDSFSSDTGGSGWSNY